MDSYIPIMIMILLMVILMTISLLNDDDDDDDDDDEDDDDNDDDDDDDDCDDHLLETATPGVGSNPLKFSDIGSSLRLSSTTMPSGGERP